MSRWGFSFNGTHSNDMGMFFKSEDRTVMPSRRVIRYQISGRDGYYEANEDTYDNRIIAGTIAFFGNIQTLPGLRDKVRDVAFWLSGSGDLVFDDEPNKAYSARIIEGISIEQLNSLGSCPVAFDCGPFAHSILYNQSTNLGVILPADIEIITSGTQKAPCIIRLVARSDIDNLVITALHKQT